MSDRPQNNPPRNLAMPIADAARSSRSLRWRTVSPLLSILCVLTIVEISTGTLLMLYYSPAVQTAWGSVLFIEKQVEAGWFIRGLHRITSDALIIASGLSVFVAVWIRAYSPPRQGVWYVSIALFLLSMALTLTGRTLPWDQHAYWGTIVRTNILAKAPLFGDPLRSLLLGGPQPGQLTLTRFFTLHILVLSVPFALLLLKLRRTRKEVFLLSDPNRDRREAVLPPAIPIRFPMNLIWNNRPTRILDLLVLAVLLFATCSAHVVLDSVSLGAPADPESVDYPARPEWFNLFLYQWLKGFQGPTAEVVGAVIIPTCVLLSLLLLPWLARRVPDRIAHGVASTFCGALALGTLTLTVVAIRADRPPSMALVESARQKTRSGGALADDELRAIRADEFHEQKDRARAESHRAITLAANGIPPSGPVDLLHADPHTRGPRLFSAHCATCHRFDGHNGLGSTSIQPATSSDLLGFGSRSWIRSLLENPMSERHFGLMKSPEGKPAHTRMSKWLAEQMDEAASDSSRQALLADFDAVTTFLEQESSGSAPIDAETLDRGRQVFFDRCNECHSYDSKRTGTLHAPEMRGYASVDWIARLIADPGHDSLYRREGKEPASMPAFADQLSEADRRLIAEWLRLSRP